MVQGKYRLSLFKRHNSERPKLTFAFRQLMFHLCSACHPDPYSATMFMVCRSSIFHIAVLKVFYLSHMVRKCLGCGCSGQRLESCTSKAAPEKFLECSIKCVCVWNIWKDVKLLTRLFSFLRISFWYLLSNCHSRGMERTYEAPSNEAPHMILGYHQGRLVTYLQHHFIFSSMATG